MCTEPHQDLIGIGEEEKPGFCSQEAQSSPGTLVYTHEAIWKQHGIKYISHLESSSTKVVRDQVPKCEMKTPYLILFLKTK